VTLRLIDRFVHRKPSAADSEKRFRRLRLKYIIEIVDREVWALLSEGTPRRTTQEIVADATRLACDQMCKEDRRR
jgi:hypothetical protein